MVKTIWGLDFGSWSLKAVRGSYDNKTDVLTVGLFDEIRYGELPCGYDASSLEKQREAVIEFRRRHDIGSGDDLCVSVTGSEVFSRFINLPPVPESMDEIIRYEARQQIPFNIDDVIWDYQPVKPQEELEIGEEIECGLFALKKERVAELLDVLAPWKGNLRIVQNAPLALYNLLHYEGLVGESCVVLDLGASTTDVLVLNPPRFWVRSLLMAGNDLTTALVEKFGVSQEEAEKIKQRISRSRHREQIMNILEPVYDELTNEIQRSLGYYKSLVRQAQFDKAVLMGSTLRMAGTREMLGRRLQYDVQVLDKLKRLQFEPDLNAEKLHAALPGFGAALGLLVQGAGKGRVHINMVPEDIALAGALSEKKPWVLAAAIGLLVLVGVVFGFERAYGARLESVERQVDWGLIDSLEQLERDYRAAQSDIESLRDDPVAQLATPGVERDVYLELLPVLGRALPRDVYLVSMNWSWQEPDEIERFVQEGTVQEQQPRARDTRRQRDLGVDDVPDWVREMERRAEEQMPPAVMQQRPERRPVRRDPDRVGLPIEEEVVPLKSDGSELVVRFSAESRVVRRGRAFIEEQVLGALRTATIDDEVPAFKRVGLLGELRDVHRHAVDGELVSDPVPGETEHFVAFDAYAVVNVERRLAEELEQEREGMER